MPCEPVCADCQCGKPKVQPILSVDDARYLLERGPWGYDERDARIMNELRRVLGEAHPGE